MCKEKQRENIGKWREKNPTTREWVKENEEIGIEG